MIEATTNECAAEFVEAGMGIAILPHTVMDSVYKYYDFDYFEISNPNAHWTVSAVYRSSYNLNVFEKDFIAMLKKVFHN